MTNSEVFVYVVDWRYNGRMGTRSLLARWCCMLLLQLTLVYSRFSLSFHFHGLFHYLCFVIFVFVGWSGLSIEWRLVDFQSWTLVQYYFCNTTTEWNVRSLVPERKLGYREVPFQRFMASHYRSQSNDSVLWSNWRSKVIITL